MSAQARYRDKAVFWEMRKYNEKRYETNSEIKMNEKTRPRGREGGSRIERKRRGRTALLKDTSYLYFLSTVQISALESGSGNKSADKCVRE